MASFKPKEIVKVLQKLGFIKRRQTGSHVIMFNPSSKVIIPVPLHNKNAKRGLLLGIIKQANSTEKEFLKLR